MDRETKIIETPIGKIKVVLNTWIIGKEKRALKNIYLRGINMEFDNKGSGKGNVKLESLTDEAEDKAIDFIVVSVDGKTENKKDIILNMQGKDYDFVINEINKITEEEEENKKKRIY